MGSCSLLMLSAGSCVRVVVRSRVLVLTDLTSRACKLRDRNRRLTRADCRYLPLTALLAAFCLLGGPYPPGVAMFLESQAWATIPFAVVTIVACMAGRALNVFSVTRQINKMRKPARRIPKEHVWALWVAGLRGGDFFP